MSFYRTHFLKDFIYLFLERREEKKRERNINVWSPLPHPLLGTWTATQACALSGNQTSNPFASQSASQSAELRQPKLLIAFFKSSTFWQGLK